MLVVPVFLLVLVGVAVLAASASERPPMLSVLALGGACLLALLLAAAVVGVGLRGDGEEGDGAPSAVTAPVPTERPSVEVRAVDAVIRPRGTSDPLDRLPDVTTRLIRVRTVEPVVVRQCAGDDRCSPGVPMRSIDDSALGLVELRRRVGEEDCATVRCTLVVTRGRSSHVVATVPLWFGRAAPVLPAPQPVVRPSPPTVHPDLPGGRLAVGLAGAAALLALAAWLLRRRPDERVADPFWDVSLEVPEWEGVRVEVDDEEWLSPAGGPRAPSAR